MLGAVLGAVALTAWVFTVVGVAYVLWRYAYTPFMVMRRDIAALNEKVEELREYTKQEFGLRAARALSDEEQARMEAASRRLNVWQQLNQGRG